MSMNVNKMAAPGGGGNLGDATIGAHYARLVGFSYIGVHERTAYKGKAKDPCGKLLFTFELLDDFVEIEGVTRPRWITKKENAFSTSNANAVKIYNTLDPTGQYNGDFDKLALATTPCMITIGPRRDANDAPIDGVRIDAIAPVAKDPQGNEYALNPAANPVIVFDFDEPTAESYASLKPWMQKLVKEANNFAGSACERVAQAHDANEAAAEGGAAQQQPPQTQGVNAQSQPPGQQPPPLNQPPAQQPPPQQQQAQPPGPAPVQQQAPVQTQQAPPQAPPGFRYDAATNSFVPEDTPATAGGQQPPPAGGTAY